MADVGELQPEELTFLAPYLPVRNLVRDLPFVTLTYASSLDSMIALAAGARTTLSGAETKRMTHYLRLRHDAILIGAGTAVADDPSLNCRYPGATFADQPRPVVVDPNARWKCDGGKALALAGNGQGKGPWIVSRRGAPAPQHLLNVGGDYLTVDGDENEASASGNHDQLPWLGLLRALKCRGIESVMIEGGAHIINKLLHMPGLVDAVVITIAPTWLGCGGVKVQPDAKTVNGERVNAATLQSTSWRQLGNDVVLCGRLIEK